MRDSALSEDVATWPISSQHDQIHVPASAGGISYVFFCLFHFSVDNSLFDAFHLLDLCVGV